MYFFRAILFIFLIARADLAQARVFTFGNNWVAAYFRGTCGMSQVGDNLFADTSGTNTTFDDEVLYNLSGELGFSFLLNDNLTVRVGIEGLQTKNLAVVGNKLSTATKYFDIESRATTFNPNITFEVGFANTGKSKFFGFAGVGQSTVKVSNDYTATATADADYALTNLTFKDSWESTALAYQVGVGWETSFIDNVTFNLEAGWRMLDVTDFEYRADGFAVRGGSEVAVTSGTSVVNNAGNKMSIDMGGAFVGVMFRFYIPPLN